MRVIDRVEPEQAFSEGEPDLEPPEELAIAEMDDETVLEEELDNDDVSEDDVDDDVLSSTLEHLVHLSDDDEGRTVDDGGPDAEIEASDASDELLEVLEVDDLEDLEESLDRLLEVRLALGDDDGEGADDTETDGARQPVVLVLMSAAASAGTSPCGSGEFVCSRCFLVRSVVQLADASGGLCRDCAS